MQHDLAAEGMAAPDFNDWKSRIPVLKPYSLILLSVLASPLAP